MFFVEIIFPFQWSIKPFATLTISSVVKHCPARPDFNVIIQPAKHSIGKKASQIHRPATALLCRGCDADCGPSSSRSLLSERFAFSSRGCAHIRRFPCTISAPRAAPPSRSSTRVSRPAAPRRERNTFLERRKRSGLGQNAMKGQRPGTPSTAIEPPAAAAQRGSDSLSSLSLALFFALPNRRPPAGD